MATATLEAMEELGYTDDEMSALPITVFRKSTDSEMGV
jgi:hypothetical protein